MAICPAGHDSAGDDFCDVCGILITAAPSLAQAPTALAEACPQCGAPRVGQFCETCGHDFAAPASVPQPAPAPAPQAPAVPVTLSWTAVVTADRDYYESVLGAGGPDTADIAFPAYCPERRFRLDGPEVRVGRRSVARGLEPEIDLSGPPRDPGISRLHVVLVRTADGAWSAVDPGSENGTLVNGTELPHDRSVPLHDGDRIHLGAWTELRLINEG